MKKRIINLMKKAVKGYCKAAVLMYPTGSIPVR